MFEDVQDKFYKSLVGSIKDRKKSLKLRRDEILPDPKRVTNITKIVRNAHCPYLITKNEYSRLIYLFLCKDRESFIKENITKTDAETLRKKCGSNYDEMLWGHINWDEIYQDVITELSESDSSEGLAKDFEEALDDYIPYVIIKYDKLYPERLRVFYSADEIKEKRQKAVEWVHLRHGSGLFKQTFYERFSGKTLREFDKEFDDFIKEYLSRRKLKDCSLGLQVRRMHTDISGYVAQYDIPKAQCTDMRGEESELQKTLREYVADGREQMYKLGELQRKFDALHIDIGEIPFMEDYYECI